MTLSMAYSKSRSVTEAPLSLAACRAASFTMLAMSAPVYVHGGMIKYILNLNCMCTFQTTTCRKILLLLHDRCPSTKIHPLNFIIPVASFQGSLGGGEREPGNHCLRMCQNLCKLAVDYSNIWSAYHRGSA